MKQKRAPKLWMRGAKGARYYDVIVDGRLLGTVQRDSRFPATWTATARGLRGLGFATRQLAVGHVVRLFYPLGL